MITVIVFGTNHLEEQVGASGVNELLITLAARFQRAVGTINPVGRYVDNGFVALIETMRSPKDVKRMAFDVATELQMPMDIAALRGEPCTIRPDIGVGVTHIIDGRTGVDELLHEGERLAMSGRRMRFRVAVRDPGDRQIAALDSLVLNTRW